MADGGEFNVYNVLASQLAGIESRLTRRLDDIAKGQQLGLERVIILEGRVSVLEQNADEERENKKWNKRLAISAFVMALLMPLMVGLILASVLVP